MKLEIEKREQWVGRRERKVGERERREKGKDQGFNDDVTVDVIEKRSRVFLQDRDGKIPGSFYREESLHDVIFGFFSQSWISV